MIKLEKPISLVTVNPVEEQRQEITGFIPGKVTYDNAERGAQVVVKFDNPNVPERLITLWQLDEYDAIGQFTDDDVNKRIIEILNKE